MAMSARLLRPRASGFNPKSISGLVAWFDADDASTFTLNGTAVSEWRDKSGNGYSVSQGTANNQPARTGTVLGRAAIDFDGVNDCLFSDGTGLSAAYSGNKSITVVVVGEMHSNAERAVNDIGTWVSFGSSSSGTPFAYFRSAAGSGNLQLALRTDASSTAGGLTATNLGPAGNALSGNGDFFIVSMTLPSQSQPTARVHNVLTNTGDSIAAQRSQQGLTQQAAESRPSGNTTVDSFCVGALGRNTFSDFFPARLSEIVIYNSALPNSSRSLLIKWLSNKYQKVAVPVL